MDMSKWIAYKTLFWVIVIGTAAYFSPKVVSNLKTLEKHTLLTTVQGKCETEHFRYKFYIPSDGVSPAPFKNIFLPIYSTHNLSNFHIDVETAVVSIHGLGRRAGTMNRYVVPVSGYIDMYQKITFAKPFGLPVIDQALL